MMYNHHHLVEIGNFKRGTVPYLFICDVKIIRDNSLQLNEDNIKRTSWCIE